MGGGPLAEERVAFADRPESPDRPRPRGTRSRVWGYQGPVGGPPGRGHHPDGAPDPYGATAPRRGPRVMAAAHGLPSGVGSPGRKVPTVLAPVTGGRVTQGALPQAARRRAAGPIGSAYEPWRAGGLEAPVGQTEDTGGRAGGPPAPLMACETAAATRSHVRPRHRHEAVQEVRPAD